jgi:hypothetical protein
MCTKNYSKTGKELGKVKQRRQHGRRTLLLCNEEGAYPASLYSLVCAFLIARSLDPDNDVRRYPGLTATCTSGERQVGRDIVQLGTGPTSRTPGKL